MTAEMARGNSKPKGVEGGGSAVYTSSTVGRMYCAYFRSTWRLYFVLTVLSQNLSISVSTLRADGGLQSTPSVLQCAMRYLSLHVGGPTRSTVPKDLVQSTSTEYGAGVKNSVFSYFCIFVFSDFKD